MGRLKNAVSESRKKKKKKAKTVEAADTNGRPPSRSRARRAQSAGKSSRVRTAQPSQQEEPEAVKKARIRIRAFVREVTKDAPKASIGLVLALVNQETGSHKAANALIDELDLEKTFGIRKF